MSAVGHYAHIDECGWAVEGYCHSVRARLGSLHVFRIEDGLANRMAALGRHSHMVRVAGSVTDGCDARLSVIPTDGDNVGITMQLCLRVFHVDTGLGSLWN